MSMSLNKVMLIGRVTHDPELRYTPQGTAVCTFSVATNRVWTDNSGQRQEDVEFTRCVAWTKLAEICSQILHKGRQVFVDGRLKTREWEGQDGFKRRTTEMVINNMIALGPPGSMVADTALASSAGQGPPDEDLAVFAEGEKEEGEKEKDKKKEKKSRGKGKKRKDSQDEEVSPEEIPF